MMRAENRDDARRTITYLDIRFFYEPSINELLNFSECRQQPQKEKNCSEYYRILETADRPAISSL
jgi:hypothetical protein